MMNSPLPFIIFQLLFTFAVFADVKVSVMNGDSVTLNSGDSKIPRDHLILWTFGPDALIIAERSKAMVSVYGHGEKFRKRLHLNNTNGDLTIKNMSKEHSGLYQVKIVTETATIYKKFSISVSIFHEVKVSVMEGDSVTLDTGYPVIPRDHLILWIFESETIVTAERNETMASVYGHDLRYRYKLNLNDQNGDLTIKKMKMEFAGTYQVKVIAERATIYKRFSVTVTPADALSPEFMSKVISVFMSALLIGFLVLLGFHCLAP